MKAITKVLAGGVAIAALASAAPAAAQYYPGYGYGAPNGGYGNNGYGYGANNSQAAVSQCVGAVQQRLNGGYGGYGSPNGGYGAPYGGYGAPYGGYGAYGAPYGGYGNARVLGISRVEPRSDGGLTVRGVANSGRYAGSAYGYNAEPRVDLTFRCKTDYRGVVYDVDINQAQSNYGSNYTPWTNDYSQYGYRRY